MSDNVIWSGQMGSIGKRYDVEVLRLSDSAFRGVMRILDSNEEVLYQKEVAISHNSPFGADVFVAASWAQVFENWSENIR